MAYRFLPPFFFPPLAVFFAIALIPPFTRRLVVRGLARVAAPLPPGTPARFVGALRLCAINSRAAGDRRPKKRGCQLSTPPDRSGGA